MANVQISMNGPGYVFSGSDTVTVDFQVHLNDALTTPDGIDNLLFAGAKLYNFGEVEGYNGVVFGPGAEGGLIFNEVGGAIVGLSTGAGKVAVGVAGLNDTIENWGQIFGENIAVSFGQLSFKALLDNFGVTWGAAAGVSVTSLLQGGSIFNVGTIQAGLGDNSIKESDGVEIHTAAGLTTSIVNLGKIEVLPGSTGHGIAIELGAVSLNNSGTIGNGIDDTGKGNNVIVNSGTISGWIRFGSGNDTYNGSGGTVDHIVCGAGQDNITLGNGDTFVSLAHGYDVVTAGWGNDTFWFTFHGHSDTINDFNPSLDRLDLSRGAFAGIISAHATNHLAAADFHVGAHAVTSAQHVIYNANNGFLYYDRDGSGPDGAIHFATLAPHLALTASDILVSA
jgi:Ca2+-binding RTX toxin-like protein